MTTKDLIIRAAWELLRARFTIEPVLGSSRTLWATRATKTYSIRVTACKAPTPSAVRRMATRMETEVGRYDVIVVPTRISLETAALRDGTFAAVFSLAQLRRGVISLAGQGAQDALKPKTKKK